MSAAARRKGRTGEAEARAMFTDAGWRVIAAQRNLGGSQGDAVAMKADRPLLHLEVKRAERVRMPEWLAQARAECGDAVPVVCFRQNRGEWYATVPLAELLELIG